MINSNTVQRCQWPVERKNTKNGTQRNKMKTSSVLIILLLFNSHHHCRTNINSNIDSLKKAPGVLFSPENNDTVFIQDGNTLHLEIDFEKYYEILINLGVLLKNTFPLHDSIKKQQSLSQDYYYDPSYHPTMMGYHRPIPMRSTAPRKTETTNTEYRTYIFQLREIIDIKNQKLLNDFNNWCKSLDSSESKEEQRQRLDYTHLLSTHLNKMQLTILSQFNETFGKLPRSLLNVSFSDWKIMLTIKNMIYNMFNTVELQFLQLQRGIDKMRTGNKLDCYIIPYLEYSHILTESRVSSNLSSWDTYQLTRVLSVKKKKGTNNTFEISIAIPEAYPSFFLYSTSFWHLPPKKGTTFYYPIPEERYLAVKKDNTARGKGRNLQSIQWYFISMKDLNECIKFHDVSTLYCRKKRWSTIRTAAATATTTTKDNSRLDCLGALFLQDYTVAGNRCDFQEIEQFVPVVHYLGKGIYTYNIPAETTLVITCQWNRHQEEERLQEQ